eukprot:TRINITY_DN1818_c0_g1_i1.p1 TRINITY_DN1818_c0_g1~~TRINITY_DN1818_c0_g1_i1.p1  ORF type:complete len:378 (+),score=81.88 TRINITY_DN1818_c0_g1_i1:53-1186(+)
MTTLEQNGYEIISLIGSGSFGRVQKIIRKSDQKIFACKEINYGPMGDREKQFLVSEVNILRGLNHNNIVKYIDRIVCKEKQIIYIIMEYCDNGDLAKIINHCKRKGIHMEEHVIWTIFSQLTQALYCCHHLSEGAILHRDIKPGNIFLNSSNTIKLGDFGVSRILNERSLAKTHVGTPLYMSPEQVNGLAYDIKSDIWALGCVLYEMCTLRPPFTASNHVALAQIIHSRELTPIPLELGYSSALTSLIHSMLAKNPHRRPSTGYLIEYPQIKSVMSRSGQSRASEQEIKTMNELELRKLQSELLIQKQMLQEERRQIEAEKKMIAEEKRELEYKKFKIDEAQRQLIKDRENLEKKAQRFKNLLAESVDQRKSFGSML